MNQELDKYIDRLNGLIERLSPQQRRVLTADIARRIRQSNKTRIKANIGPDGGAFTGRKGAPVRPLRANARIKAGQLFYYRGRSVRMATVKTAASAANPSRPTTKPHDDDYVWGYDTEWGGIKKYRKDQIGLPGGGVRSRLMFRKIHQYKYLQQKADANRAAVGFMRGLAGYIAAAHQSGEDTRPVRRLLGFSDGDLRQIEETVVAHLAAAEK